MQVVSGRGSLEVATVDLTGEAGVRESTVQALVDAEAVRPFDLSRGPLLRALLLRLPDAEQVLVITMHHIITDLQAFHQFFQELGLRYGAYTAGASCPWAAPAQPYAEYAVWEQQWLGSEEFSSMLSYWEQQLRGQEGLLALPTDRPRPAVQSFAGAEVPVDLSGAVLEDLQRWGRREGIPLFVTLLSAYLVLLHRYSRQSHLIVGVSFTNRRRPGSATVMGCFVNILPLSIDLSGEPHFRDVAQRVREATLEAHRHQEVTLERIVERLKQSRDLSHNPLYQAGFTFAPPAGLTLSGLAVEPWSVHPGSSQLDLFVTLWEEEKGMRGRIEYSTDLFDRATMERFLEHYRTLLASIAQDADQPIAALRILPGSEWRRSYENGMQPKCPVRMSAVSTSWSRTRRGRHPRRSPSCLRTIN